MDSTDKNQGRGGLFSDMPWGEGIGGMPPVLNQRKLERTIKEFARILVPMPMLTSVNLSKNFIDHFPM